MYRSLTMKRDQMLFSWHAMLLRGRTDLRVVGGYRAHKEVLQVISGPVHNPTIYFEALPSAQVPDEVAG